MLRFLSLTKRHLRYTSTSSSPNPLVENTSINYKLYSFLIIALGAAGGGVNFIVRLQTDPIKDSINEIKADMKETKIELKNEIKADMKDNKIELKNEIKADMKDTKIELKNEIKDLSNRFSSDMEKLANSLHLKVI